MCWQEVYRGPLGGHKTPSGAEGGKNPRSRLPTRRKTVGGGCGGRSNPIYLTHLPRLEGGRKTPSPFEVKGE